MAVNPLSFNTIGLVGDPVVYEIEKQWRWNSTSRSYYNLWICLDGSGQLNCDGIDYDFVPWTAFLIPPGSSVRGQKQNGVLRNFTAHIIPDPREPDQDLFAATAVKIKNVESFRSIIQTLLKVSIYPDDLARQQCVALVYSLLALLWREIQLPVVHSGDSIIQSQIERMRRGVDLFVSVDMLAQEAKLSRMQYSRCFKGITSMSPNRYLIQQRIDRACILLRETDWTIEAISENIGYSDRLYFNRQFKQLTGYAPGRFRH